ncbi:hypothetical protein GCM10009416_17800 [Craurococcus roseus]|uniref:Uncharacterized protein n=1 Tax=Craurococcus roseus TaxID=77585 RepID=A0ABP3Q4K9_9PROT
MDAGAGGEDQRAGGGGGEGLHGAFLPSSPGEHSRARTRRAESEPAASRPEDQAAIALRGNTRGANHRSGKRQARFRPTTMKRKRV